MRASDVLQQVADSTDSGGLGGGLDWNRRQPEQIQVRTMTLPGYPIFAKGPAQRDVRISPRRSFARATRVTRSWSRAETSVARVRS